MSARIASLICLALSCITPQAIAAADEQLARQAIRNIAVHGAEAQETHLRLMISEHHKNITMHFQLGNLLAGQQRWTEARMAYTRAAEQDIEHPDIQYNLAIALDRLEQEKKAIDHYRRALQAARTRPHHFKPEAVQQRLNELRMRGQ